MRILLIILLSASFLFAQKASQREWTIFQKGVQDYKSGKYDAALKDFQLVLSKVKDNRLLTAHRLMLAKTFYKKGSYQKSVEQCNAFLHDFPESRYIADVYYLAANNYFRLDRLQTAVQSWLHAARSATDSRLAKKALRLAEESVRYRLDDQGLAYLVSELQDPYDLQFALYHRAERDYNAGNFPAAMAALNQARALRSKNESYQKKIDKLHAYLSDKTSSAIRIAALLPFSGANAEIGQALFDGAQMAVDKYNREHGPTVEIIPYDYETRLPTALFRMREIARDPSISAVFGPVENDISAACATIADYEKLPLISPTASAAELRTLSNYLVQLNIPMDITVQKLTRYAQDSLQLKRLATVAPIDDYFVQMTRTFVEKEEQLGNEIVAQEWYYPGDQDITPRFKSLKRKGIKLTYVDSMRTVDSTLSARTIDSLYAVYQEEKREYNEETNTKVDSADIPVTVIDGLFVPVFSEDIGLIASQYAYWNIQSQILGNADWYNPEALKKNRNYINGLIFVSDGYLNEERWDYRKFRNDFREIYKRTPDKYESIGLDSFNFILSALDAAPRDLDRTGFFERIRQAPLYNGIYRNFEVGKKRFNDAARILKFTYGQILPLN